MKKDGTIIYGLPRFYTLYWDFSIFFWFTLLFYFAAYLYFSENKWLLQ